MSMRVFFFVVLIAILGWYMPSKAEIQPAQLLILNYHDIGNERGTKLTKEEFATHIDILESSGVNIIPLFQAEEFLRNGSGTAVVIMLENIKPESFKFQHPLLVHRKIPYTAFVSFNEWRHIEDIGILELARKSAYADFGLHPAAYKVKLENKDFLQNLNRGYSLFDETFGKQPAYLAFPRGMYSKDMLDAIVPYDFKIVLGANDRLMIKNEAVWSYFEITDKYVAPDRFRKLLDMNSIKVRDIVPTETLLKKSYAQVGFSLLEIGNPIKCYLRGQNKIPVTYLTDNRIELRVDLKPYQINHINCVQKTSGSDYKWLGFTFGVEEAFSLSDELPALPE